MGKAASKSNLPSNINLPSPDKASNLWILNVGSNPSPEPGGAHEFKASEIDWGILEHVCQMLGNGFPLSYITDLEGMPSYYIFKSWVLNDPKAYQIYARARTIQADFSADKQMEVAANEDIDVPRARLLIDAHQWRAAKMAPRKYGQHINAEQTLNLQQTTKVDLSNLSRDVRQQLRRALESQMKTIEHQSDEFEAD